MKGNFIKLLLLLSLITFFVIRPFLVSANYGLPGMITVSTITLPFHKIKSVLLKRNAQANSYHVSHVSACDDTNFRKLCLPFLFKCLQPLAGKILFLLLLLLASVCLPVLKGRRTLFEIISHQRHFNSLCLLRI
ncbi:hypothetical protein [Foetidibacter luteolus]|uniref:hypothetical protein n=1 Tax=Foetidibacter luteolus TaxID=2608880 RepID=UPI00129B87BE|nr:hypothetical protein [Foetidibacter luteolus]